jgi:hypothetical protein
VAERLATLAVELADDMLLDAADMVVDMVDDTDPAVEAVAVELPTAVAVWPAAQEAAVGRFVTPAGMQMLSAYLIVAIVKRVRMIPSSSGNTMLTLLVRLVADLCDAACYCLDETRVGTDACRVQVAGTGDCIDCAVLLWVKMLVESFDLNWGKLRIEKLSRVLLNASKSPRG